PITALVFGDENRAKPNPRIIRLEIILPIDVNSLTNVSERRLTTVIIIPADATMRASNLSDNLPERGENTAIVRGWATITSPALRGSNPFMYCKYKLSRNTTPNVAL